MKDKSIFLLGFIMVLMMSVFIVPVVFGANITVGAPDPAEQTVSDGNGASFTFKITDADMTAGDKYTVTVTDTCPARGTDNEQIAQITKTIDDSQSHETAVTVDIPAEKLALTGSQAEAHTITYTVTKNNESAPAGSGTAKITVNPGTDEQPTVYLRAHVENRGWDQALTPLEAGKSATIGTTGIAHRLEAIDILVPDVYQVTGFAHVQNVGDTAVTKIDNPDFDVPDGYAVYELGTTGRALRMEAACIGIRDIDGNDVKGFQYASHLQNIGWQGYVTNGSFTGTRGMCLRLESLRFTYEKAEAEKTGETP